MHKQRGKCEGTSEIPDPRAAGEPMVPRLQLLLLYPRELASEANPPPTPEPDCSPAQAASHQVSAHTNKPNPNINTKSYSKQCSIHTITQSFPNFQNYYYITKVSPQILLPTNL